jgi:hypothetical protein
MIRFSLSPLEEGTSPHRVARFGASSNDKMSFCALSDGLGNADWRLKPLRVRSRRPSSFKWIWASRLRIPVRVEWSLASSRRMAKTTLYSACASHGRPVSTSGRPIRLSVVAWSRCAGSPGGTDVDWSEMASGDPTEARNE